MKSARILIVDDNQDNLELLKHQLSKIWVSVVLASSLVEAKHFFVEGELFDLVVSDVNLGEGSGFDFLQWRSGLSYPRSIVPVLLMTSEWVQIDDKIRGLALGATDYLVRPLPMEELLARVQKALDGYRDMIRLREMLEEKSASADLIPVLAGRFHDISNLANVVLLNSESLRYRVPSVDIDLVQSLIEASRSIARMCRSSVRTCRPEEMELNPGRLLDSLYSALKLLQQRLKHCEVKIYHDTNDIMHDIDAERFKMVIINLLQNAVESIEDAGVNKGQIICNLVKKDHQVTLTIEDNGMGLSEKSKRETFHPFQSTRIAKGGTGLGLWFSSQALAGMRARLELESKGPYQGALARIVFDDTQS